MGRSGMEGEDRPLGRAARRVRRLGAVVAPARAGRGQGVNGVADRVGLRDCRRIRQDGQPTHDSLGSGQRGTAPRPTQIWAIGWPTARPATPPRLGRRRPPRPRRRWRFRVQAQGAGQGVGVRQLYPMPRPRVRHISRADHVPAQRHPPDRRPVGLGQGGPNRRGGCHLIARHRGRHGKSVSPVSSVTHRPGPARVGLRSQCRPARRFMVMRAGSGAGGSAILAPA